ncbi:hypothetical protein ERHA54_29640 [Erwinia rhapontici]|nr:hypothetical protein ERHA54_29640 [Erwinia rhapontici]
MPKPLFLIGGSLPSAFTLLAAGDAAELVKNPFTVRFGSGGVDQHGSGMPDPYMIITLAVGSGHA